jgi:hypothetical protein
MTAHTWAITIVLSQQSPIRIYAASNQFLQRIVMDDRFRPSECEQRTNRKFIESSVSLNFSSQWDLRIIDARHWRNANQSRADEKMLE